MSILIKNMEMPKRCEKCDLAYDDDGYFVCPFTKASYKSKQRPSWCPLIELPPHGDLIDACELIKNMPEWTRDYKKDEMLAECLGTIGVMPTIIEAEESKDG